MANNKLTAAQKQAIEYMVTSSNGTGLSLANQLGKHYQTIYSGLRNPVFMEAYEERLKEVWRIAGNKAVVKMEELMEEGSYQATEFILKCAKGYNPTQKVEMEADVNVIKVDIVDD